MQVAFSRFRVSMELASEKVYALVAQALWWALIIAIVIVAWAIFNTDASAHGRRHHHHSYVWLDHAQLRTAHAETRRIHRSAGSEGRRVRRGVPTDANRNDTGLVKVSTAAGIEVTVAHAFASKIQGFIGDLVARGYHPRQIHCYASGGHVRGSLHYSGQACDFDQTGWGRTAAPMYHVADLVKKWGLRDGGEFRDWGHIDMGEHLSRHRRYAAIKATPFYGATSLYQNPQMQ